MPDDAEARQLLALLAESRRAVLRTAANLTDEQARLTPTVSDLSIGGLVKHLAATEKSWLQFAVQAGADQTDWDAVDWDHLDSIPDGEVPEWLKQSADEFRMLPDETLAQVVAAYRTVAAETERLVLELADLGVTHPLPPAPWVPDGATRSAREVLLRMIAETAQHAGHADILRESIDGQKSTA